MIMSLFRAHQYSKVQAEDVNEEVDSRPWFSPRWMRLAVLAMFCFSAGAIFAEGLRFLNTHLRHPPPSLERELTRGRLQALGLNSDHST